MYNYVNKSRISLRSGLNSLTKMRGYKCEKCDHTTSRRSSLAQHVERVHNECSQEEDLDGGLGVITLLKP